MITIKKAASLTGLTATAIRHYESIGLMQASSRTDAGYRLYSPEVISRLRKIKYYRDLKFPLRKIGELLDAPIDNILQEMKQQSIKAERELEEYHLIKDVIDAFLSTEHKQHPFNRSDLAVIAIDLQNDIIEGGSLACPRINSILPNLSTLFDKARFLGVPIIYVCDWHKKGDPELVLWNDHMIADTWGAQIIDVVAPKENDIIVRKNLFNGFKNTDLLKRLNELNSKTLIFTGWRTHVCVAQTAIEAFYKGYQVTIASDGVQSTSQREHDFGMTLMDINYGFDFYPCENILETLLSEK